MKYTLAIIIGFIIQGIAFLTPITYDVRFRPDHEMEYTTIPEFGIEHPLFYINLLLISVPLLIGFYGKGVVAKVFIVIVGVFTCIAITVAAKIMSFNWGGPVSGDISAGFIFLIFGNIFLVIGALLTTHQLERYEP